MKNRHKYFDERSERRKKVIGFGVHRFLRVIERWDGHGKLRRRNNIYKAIFRQQEALREFTANASEA